MKFATRHSGLVSSFVTSAILAAGLSAGINRSMAAVTVTVTPSATSNSYTGPITLNISGLTSGEQVTVQTYLDLNGSGVVQANDPLIDVFNISDGGVTTIGGITNISVPYDSNPAAGAITTTLSFAPPLESLVGQKIYRVLSNPSGAFTPVTAVLNITNAATGQFAGGVVYSNGVAPLAGAIVVALTAQDQHYGSAAITDSSGHYSLALIPGSYVLLAALPGYYADQSMAPQFTLTNGVSVTNNLVLTNGTVAISGSVYDLSSSNTLGGVFIQAQNNNLFEVVFTDTNGNYTFYGTSNNWKLKIEADRLSRRGYLSPQNNALIAMAGAGPVTNGNIGLYRGNALFYGQVTVSNVPVANVPMSCNDTEQLLNSKSFTDMNGNYGVVALVSTNAFGTNSVAWNCSPNIGDLTGIETVNYGNYIFSDINGVQLATNQADLQNFIGLPVTATISGQLVNNNGTPISGVSVGASASINGNQFVTAFIDTDNNGYFSFGAAPGEWYVNANCCGNHGLDNSGYYDPAGYHIVNIPPTNPVVNIVVYPANVPLLGQPQKISQSQFNLNLYGASGYNYTVQSGTNLVSTQWSTVASVTNFPGSPYLIQDFQATNTARFYRAFETP